MHAHITLTVMDGKLEGKEYGFSRRQNCVIGRAGDCEICLPDALEYLTVSRHHCLLEVDPPEIRVRPRQQERHLRERRANRRQAERRRGRR
ncbi:MAG TPA: FHA domain-containing protein [Gemmataceae bacterium]|jgi:serine/threonine-protein kinase|nr:FHA domain-containing protein [Gemmataceae bacterium]